MSVQTEIRRHTIRTLRAKKGKERVTMLTAYDVVTAQCLDEAGVEILLVGDSVGNVLYGMDSTLPVTLAMITAHSKAVVKGSSRALVVADLPFLTYQISAEEALRNAGTCMIESGAQAVKLEGASKEICETIRRLTDAGIPVMGHIGLRPQSVHQMGGYFTHGKTATEAAVLLGEAQALQAAGCFAIVLECIQPEIAKQITDALQILTVGIGSGEVCDGEVLVINDLLGLTPGKSPKFAQPVVDLKAVVTQVGRRFVERTREAKPSEREIRV